MDAFEQAGRAFVEAANPPGTPEYARRYFVNDVPTRVLLRGAGGSIFNETLSSCKLDSDAYAEALERRWRWVQDLRLCPSWGDIDAMGLRLGYGGRDAAMFLGGHAAMVSSGRWMLIAHRRANSRIDVGFARLPTSGFENTLLTRRGTGIYAGTPYPEYAMRFLEFLASDDYNRLIVKDADALPPRPDAALSPGYQRPEMFPREWHFHGPHLDYATEHGYPEVWSPFVADRAVGEALAHFERQFRSGHISAKDAGRLITRRINRHMDLRADADPALRVRLHQQRTLQTLIDDRLSRGDPIPQNWIFNPVLLAHHRQAGRVTDAAPMPDAVTGRRLSP